MVQACKATTERPAGEGYKLLLAYSTGMYVLGVVAPAGVEVTPLVERLVNRLAGHGRVATVERSTGEQESTQPRPSDAVASYRLARDGEWVGTGDHRTLPETLDELAPRYDYALVTGFDDARLPHVVVGDAESAGEVLLETPTVEDVDPATVIEGLHATDPYVTLEALVEEVKNSPHAEKAGAIATFTGRVRARDHEDDDPTEYLEFEKYEGVAEERLATIREELEARDGVYEVRSHHRTGVIEYGEDIVFVVVLAGHREEAFQTVQDGINRLKAEVPIFKKEVTTDDAFWVHTRG